MYSPVVPPFQEKTFVDFDRGGAIMESGGRNGKRWKICALVVEVVTAMVGGGDEIVEASNV